MKQKEQKNTQLHTVDILVISEMLLKLLPFVFDVHPNTFLRLHFAFEKGNEHICHQSFHVYINVLPSPNNLYAIK